MVHSDATHVHGEPGVFHTDLRYNTDLPMALQFWTTALARSILRFGVFLRGASIMFQIPGGAKFDFVLNDEDEDEISTWVRDRSRKSLLNILADCLKRLEAPPVLPERLGLTFEHVSTGSVGTPDRCITGAAARFASRTRGFSTTQHSSRCV